MNSQPTGMKMEDISSQEIIYLKSFLGAKSKQINHYVKPTLDNTNMIVPWFI